MYSVQAWIQKREKRTGVRWEVVYRLPGSRKQKTFTFGPGRSAKRLAKERLAFVERELASGRDPRETLSALGREPEAKVTLAQMYEKWIASKSNVDEQTRVGYRTANAFWLRMLGNIAVESITRDLLQGIVNEAGSAEPGEKPPYSRSSLSKYLTNLKQPLDHAGVTPNPARSGVNIPKQDDKQKVPPTRSQLERVLFRMRQKGVEGQERAQVVDFIQAHGVRISEALGLRVMDIDFKNGAMRVYKSKTHSGERFLPVVPAFMEQLRVLCERADWEPRASVFRRVAQDGVRDSLRDAAIEAKVPHVHPHLLRHDRVSLWVAMGVNPVTAKEWAGHKDTKITLDTYGHVVDWTEDPHHGFWQDAAQSWAVKKNKTTLREAA